MLIGALLSAGRNEPMRDQNIVSDVSCPTIFNGMPPLIRADLLRLRVRIAFPATAPRRPIRIG